MYIGFGWPTALTPLSECEDAYILTAADGLLFIAATRTSVQVWSGGPGRVLLGSHVLTAADQAEHGFHVAACWSPARRTLAVVTSRSQLLFYGLQQTAEQVVPGLPSYVAVQPYVKEHAYLPHNAPPLALAADARSVLVAHTDGCVSTTTWNGKVKAELVSPLEELVLLRWGGSSAPHGPHLSSAASAPAAVGLAPAAGAGAAAAGAVTPLAPPTPQQQQQLAPGGPSLVTALSSGSNGSHSSSGGAAAAATGGAPAVSISAMAYELGSRVVVVVLTDGSVAALKTAEQELHPVADWSLSHWLCGREAGARCVSIAAASRMVAVGCADGVVHLYRLHMPSGLHGGAGSCSQHLLSPTLHLRSLSLADWGHTAAVTGAVAALAWAPDCRALAVGFSRQGMVVWTPSGCRVLCTIRQAAADTPRAAAAAAASASGPALRPQTSRLAVCSSSGEPPHWQQQQHHHHHAGASLLEGSVQTLAWGPLGYQLLVGERAVPALGGHSGLVELSMAKALSNHHRVPSHVTAPAAAGAAGGGGTGAGSGAAAAGTSSNGAAAHGDELHVLQAHDRLLLITEASSAPTSPGTLLAAALARQASAAGGGASSGPSDLLLHHVPLPAAYVGAHWPLVHAAVSRSGGDVAVACRRGLAVYNRRSERWRLFGDVSQEKRVEAVALGWLDSCVVTCSLVHHASSSSSTSSGAGSGDAAAPAAGGSLAGLGSWEGTNLGLACGQSQHQQNQQQGGAAHPCEVLVFPRNHLDYSSLVASYQLPSAPAAMDCAGGYVVLASHPLELLVLQLRPLSAAAAAAAGPGSAAAGAAVRQELVAVRELSLCNPAQPLCGLALVLEALPPSSSSSSSDKAALAAAGTATRGSSTKDGKTNSSGRQATSSPQRCVLLRWGGLMSVLDLAKGSEMALSADVECFWLSDTLAVKASGSGSASGAGSRSHSRSSSAQGVELLPGGGGASSFSSPGLQRQLESALRDLSQVSLAGSQAVQEPEVVEMPWWAYGPSGMQLWFPSLLTPSSSAAATHKLHHAASSSHLSARAPATPTAAAAAAAAAAAGAATTPTKRPAAAASAAAAVPAPGSPGGHPHLHPTKSAPSLGLVKADSLTMPLAAVAADGVVNEPELEFDQEVYPVGVSLADAAIVGVTQRLMRSQHPASPWAAPDAPPVGVPHLLPVPESQPVLPALLRRLLQKGALNEALALAAQHAAGPHFGRSLEWLLFTTLDLEGAKGKRSTSTTAGSARAAGVLARIGKGWRGHVSGDPGPVVISPLLAAAAELLLAFPGHADVVVSVSRKTDASLWPALFSALGSPGALLEHLQEVGALQSAACFLVVVDRLEGPHLAHAAALKLVAAALKRSQYSLVAEILRFLIPPGDNGAPSLARHASGSVGGGAPQQQQGGEAGGSNGSTASGAAAAAANGGSGGWFSWLWGGSSAGGDARPAGTSGSSGADSPLGNGGAAVGEGGRSSSGGGGGYSRRSSSMSRPGGGAPWEGSSAGDGSPGLDACHLVAEHAWALLDQGKFSQLLQLLASMSFLSGGLAAIMNAYRDALASGTLAVPVGGRRNTLTGGLTPAAARPASSPTKAAAAAAGSGAGGLASRQQQQQQWTAAAAAAAALPGVLQEALAAGHGGSSSSSSQLEPPGVEQLLSSLAVAMQELPVWEGEAVEQDATMLLELCQTLGVQRWVLTLAVLLVDMAHISPFAQQQPELWLTFCQELRANSDFYFLHGVVDALTLGGSA